MKRETKSWVWCVILALFPLLMACNNENDDTPIGSPVREYITLHIDFINADGDDLVALLDSYQIPLGALAEKSDDWIGLLPGDYMLNVYLDGNYMESSDEPNNFFLCLVKDSPLKKGHKGLYFFSSKAEDEIRSDNKSGHVIEFKFTCEALFKDSEEHVIRFNYLPPSPGGLIFDYKGEVSLDGTMLDVVYRDDPEFLKGSNNKARLSVIATL